MLSPLFFKGLISFKLRTYKLAALFLSLCMLRQFSRTCCWRPFVTQRQGAVQWHPRVIILANISAVDLYTPASRGA